MALPLSCTPHAHRPSLPPQRATPHAKSYPLTDQFRAVIQKAYERLNDPINLENRIQLRLQVVEAIDSSTLLTRLLPLLERAIKPLGKKAPLLPFSHPHLPTLRDHIAEVSTVQQHLELRIWNLNKALNPKANQVRSLPALLLVPQENKGEEGGERKSSPLPAAAPVEKESCAPFEYAL